MNKKYIIIVLIAITTFSSAFAQEQFNLRDRARKLLDEYQYFQAANLYQKLVDVKSPKLVDMEDLAYCYIKLQDFEAAENWYARVVANKDSKPENFIKYGESLKSNLKYVEAKKAFQSYSALTGDQKSVELNLAGCDSAMTWIANPTIHQLKNEEGVNTPLSNFGAYPIKNSLFFVSEPDVKSKNVYGRTGRPYLRIYDAARAGDNSLSSPKLDSSIFNNGNYHIGPIATNKNGNVFYVTRTTTGKTLEVERKGGFKYSTANLELYIFTLKDGKLEEKPFPYNNVEKFSVGHANLSTDEKTLYFVSNMQGGLGGTDIWFCELQNDGTWGAPKNAGSNINTARDEMFPMINIDGTMYLSSNGWPGMGGLDVFGAKGEKQNWTKPQNLKYPLNSAADDFSYLMTTNSADVVKGYLSSNRKGGVGNDDIYSFTYNYIAPKLILALKGNVLNKKNGEIIPDASVTLYGDGQQIVARQSSTQKGTFLFDISPEKTYQVLAQKEKFYADSMSISTVGIAKSQTLTADLKLEPLYEIGKTIELKNILYDFDKDNIRADAAKILNELVRTMRDNPSLEIELGSHTDSRGVDVYNLDLSQRRAKSVVNYLVSRGIARERMTAKGYGETQLLNKCSNGVNCTVEEHQANRRTEFKITKY